MPYTTIMIILILSNLVIHKYEEELNEIAVALLTYLATLDSIKSLFKLLFFLFRDSTVDTANFDRFFLCLAISH